MDLIHPSVFAASLTDVPLSADFNGELLLRSREGDAPSKQTVRYRVYRDSQKRISVFLESSPDETVPLFMLDPPNDAFTWFDAASRTGYRILMPGAGLSRDKRLFPVPGGNPMHEFGGNQHIRSGELGRATVNGMECVRTRGTIIVENQPALRHVTERCFSQTLGLLVEYTSTGPKGDAHVTLDHIQHGAPPPEVFSVPANYSITDVQLPTDGAPSLPPH